VSVEDMVAVREHHRQLVVCPIDVQVSYSFKIKRHINRGNFASSGDGGEQGGGLMPALLLIIL